MAEVRGRAVIAPGGCPPRGLPGWRRRLAPSPFFRFAAIADELATESDPGSQQLTISVTVVYAL
jgi:hypothetical protein